MIFSTIKHASISINNDGACEILGRLIARCDSLVCESLENAKYTDLHLSRTPQGLVLDWRQSKAQTLKYNIDFEKEFAKHRTFPIPKQGAFNQALGKKTHSVIDASGGWGGDAILMCMQGYQLTIIERVPLMAALIDDALVRLAGSPLFQGKGLTLPKVICGEASTILPSLVGNADCVYLDPMFPPKKKKSAASNKQMQLLQWLLGEDLDASDTAISAYNNFPRVAVKRPDYAQSLAQDEIGLPEVKFSSKLVHYDVYLADNSSAKS